MSANADQERLAALEQERDTQRALLLQDEEIAGLGHWSWDAVTDTTTWSPGVYRIHGLDPALPPPDLAGVLSLYEPTDAEKLRGLVERAVSHGESYALEARIRRPDGDIRHVSARGGCQTGADGRTVALFGAFIDITDMRLADERLRSNEERLRFLIEHSADVILRGDENQGVTWISSRCRDYGYEPEELLGTQAAALIHPDDIPKILATRQARLEGSETPSDRSSEYRIRTKSGDWAWVEDRPTIIRDANGRVLESVNFLRDVTDRKAAEAALAESEVRHSVVSEYARDVITRTRLDGQVLYISPSCLEVSGYAFEEFAGYRPGFMKCIHPDDAKAALNHVGKVARGEPTDTPRLRYRFQHKAGHWIWLESTPTLVRDAQGNPSEIIDVIRDVTAQQQVAEDLRQARDAAEAAAAIKSDFMANMSHEIRTPLTAILGFTDILAARHDLADDARRQVGRIATAGQALLSIVNDILDFSKLEAGLVSLSPRPTDPAALIRDTLPMFEAQAAAKGLTLSLDLPDTLPDGVAIDPDRTRQILINLIGNAVKFTDKGGVEVIAAYEAGRLSVSVRDTGAGMTKAQQTKLFQRFSQVDASSTRRHGGTGLGLAICKGLTEAMGGSISVVSHLGRGSAFRFDIPATITDRPVAAPGGVVDDPSALTDLRVLVIDDNPMNRELARAILEQLGASVTDAGSGSEGLDLANAWPVDVILLDLRMPDMSGSEVLAAIRSGDGPNQDIPILAFTADANLEGLQKDHGFDGVVRKPIAPSEVAHAILAATTWGDDRDQDQPDVAA